MCQLHYANTGDDLLNKQLSILMSAFGSGTHKHGWGVADTHGKTVKSCIPAHLITNSGHLLKNYSGPLFGHIRLASANVPVTNANAHPFILDEILQFHNGTLTPNLPTKFQTEIEIKSTDEKGTEKTEKIKRSDSLVFFEHVIAKYNAQKEKKFPDAVKEAMEDFHGKFALMYYLRATGERYVFRGKLAELHISYRLDADKKVLGYVINTSDEILDAAITAANNLREAEGKEYETFTNPEPLKEETIFSLEPLEVKEIGTIKEKTYYSGAYTNRYAEWEDEWGLSDGAARGTRNGVNAPTNYAGESETKMAKYIFEFMEEYSMSVRDIQYVFWLSYGLSLKEATPMIMQHFTKKVIEGLKSATTRAIRKQVKALCNGIFPTDFYISEEIQFPWMINDKKTQTKILDLLRDRKKKMAAG